MYRYSSLRNISGKIAVILLIGCCTLHSALTRLACNENSNMNSTALCKVVQEAKSIAVDKELMTNRLTFELRILLGT